MGIYYDKMEEVISNLYIVEKVFLVLMISIVLSFMIVQLIKNR